MPAAIPQEGRNGDPRPISGSYSLLLPNKYSTAEVRQNITALLQPRMPLSILMRHNVML